MIFNQYNFNSKLPDDAESKVKKIAIFSDNEPLCELCCKALSSVYHIGRINELQPSVDVVIIDSDKIDQDKNLSSFFNNKSIRILIIGSNWTEENQIEAVVQGAAGYCEKTIGAELLLKAVDSILGGDIWIQRHLVPKVIEELMQMKSSNIGKVENKQSSDSFCQALGLSSREVDVAKLIQIGESNKTIASTLCISERTVKAHLTSIFKKLKVRDRLHLALFIRENA